MSTSAVEALAVQDAVLHRLLNSLDTDDWVRPTRCPPLTVIELVAHVEWAYRFWRWLVGGPGATSPSTTLTRFLTPTAGTEVGAAVVARAKQAVVGASGDEVAARVRAAATDYLDAIADLSSELVVGDPAVLALRLRELVDLGVFEIGVHTLDVADAVGRPATFEPLVGAVITNVLDGLLGSRCAVEWDDVTYALTATGRRPLSDAERSMLGADADRFPLMS